MSRQGPRAVGLVLDRNLNFWVATEALKWGRLKSTTTGISLSRQKWLLGYRDLVFGVVTEKLHGEKKKSIAT